MGFRRFGCEAATACSQGREPQEPSPPSSSRAPEGRRQLAARGLPSPFQGSWEIGWPRFLGLAPQATCLCRFAAGRVGNALSSQVGLRLSRPGIIGVIVLLVGNALSSMVGLRLEGSKLIHVAVDEVGNALSRTVGLRLWSRWSPEPHYVKQCRKRPEQYGGICDDDT